MLLSGHRFESHMKTPNPSITLAVTPKKVANKESESIQVIRNQTNFTSMRLNELAVFWGGCFEKSPEVLPINRQTVITNETNALGNREELSSTYIPVDYQSIMNTKPDCAVLMPYQSPSNSMSKLDSVNYVVLAMKLSEANPELIGVMIAIPPRSFFEEIMIGTSIAISLLMLGIILKYCCCEDSQIPDTRPRCTCTWGRSKSRVRENLLILKTLKLKFSKPVQMHA